MSIESLSIPQRRLLDLSPNVISRLSDTCKPRIECLPAKRNLDFWGFLNRCRLSKSCGPLHTPSAKKNNFLSLPDEMLIKIFSCTDEKSLLNLTATCKRFYDVAHDDFLWREIFKRTFPTRFNRLPPETSLQWETLQKQAYAVEKNYKTGNYQFSQNFQPHSSRLTTLLALPNQVVSAEANGEIKIWSEEDLSYKIEQSITNCQDGQFKISQDGRYLIFLRNGSLIVMHRPDMNYKFEHLQTLLANQTDPENPSKIHNFCISDKQLIFISENHQLSVWDMKNDGKFKFSFSLTEVTKFYQMDDSIILALEDNSLQILKRTENGRFSDPESLLETTEDSLGTIGGIVSHEKQIIVYDLNGLLKVFSQDDSAKFKEIESHQITVFMDSITKICLQDQYLAVGCLRGAVRVFKKNAIGTYEQVKLIQNHQNRINAILFFDDLLCIGSSDNSISVWKLPKDGPVHHLLTLTQTNEAVTTLCVYKDQIIAGSNTGKISIWNFNC